MEKSHMNTVNIEVSFLARGLFIINPSRKVVRLRELRRLHLAVGRQKKCRRANVGFYFLFSLSFMKYFSTFSGIGGFEIPLQEFGHECVGYSEIDKHAIQLYSSHFLSHHNYGNITRISADALPNFELLVGGFPCQSFSVAGRRKGFDDTRGTLFFDLCRLARTKQPRLLLFENVKGLLHHESGETFRIILNTLDELGYDCQWQLLNSQDFGVPQNRERLFLVGHFRGTSRPEIFPLGNFQSISDTPTRTNKRRTQTAVSHTIRGHNNKADNMFVDEGDDRIRRFTPIECERLQGFPDHWTTGVSDTQRFKCLGNAVTVNVVREIVKRL